MLHTLTDDGMMGWACGDCGTENSAPIRLATIQQPEGAPKHRRTARLPACPQCGATVHLKIDFTEAELRAPNMIDRNGNPTRSRAVAGRHMALAKQLEAIG